MRELIEINVTWLVTSATIPLGWVLRESDWAPQWLAEVGFHWHFVAGDQEFPVSYTVQDSPSQ